MRCVAYQCVNGGVKFGEDLEKRLVAVHPLQLWACCLWRRRRRRWEGGERREEGEREKEEEVIS